MLELISVTTHATEQSRRRGYPANHALDKQTGDVLCGINLRSFFINGGLEEVNCKRCQKKLASIKADNSR